MLLTLDEAAHNLAQAAKTQRRSVETFGYRQAAPHLILWGAIWIAGYLQNDLFPRYENAGWIALILAGVIGGAVIGRRYHILDRGIFAWRMIAAAAVVLFFVRTSYAIMGPVRGSAMAVFPVLIVGTLQTVFGLWAGLRFVVVGIAVLAAALGGFYLVHEHLLLWMAFAGGGSMVLSGLWFRRA